MNDFDHLRIERSHHGVVTASLDVTGHSVNVIHREVLRELALVVETVADDSSARFLVLRSAKPRGFAAGADLSEVRSLANRKEVDEFLNAGRALGARLRSLTIPTLAILHGACVGGGLELAMSCRARIAVDDPATRLGLPEANLGLIPGWGGTQLLPELVGPSRGARLILNASLVSAREAKRVGLVNAVFPPAELEHRLAGFIERQSHPPRHRPARYGRISRLRWSWAVPTLRRECRDASADNPALYAALQSIDAGIRHGWDAGLQAERDEFHRILFDPRSRNLLDQFFTQRGG